MQTRALQRPAAFAIAPGEAREAVSAVSVLNTATLGALADVFCHKFVDKSDAEDEISRLAFSGRRHLRGAVALASVRSPALERCDSGLRGLHVIYAFHYFFSAHNLERNILILHNLV